MLIYLRKYIKFAGIIQQYSAGKQAIPACSKLATIRQGKCGIKTAPG